LDLGLGPGDLQSQRPGFLSHHTESTAKNVHHFSKKHAVISEVKVSDLDIANACTAA
jgi:hypothetical protein